MYTIRGAFDNIRVQTASDYHFIFGRKRDT